MAKAKKTAQNRPLQSVLDFDGKGDYVNCRNPPADLNLTKFRGLIPQQDRHNVLGRGLRMQSCSSTALLCETLCGKRSFTRILRRGRPQERNAALNPRHKIALLPLRIANWFNLSGSL